MRLIINLFDKHRLTVNVGAAAAEISASSPEQSEIGAAALTIHNSAEKPQMISASEAKSETPTRANKVCHLALGGLTCHSCEIRVERCLKKIPGILKVDVNAARQRARLVCREDCVPDLAVLRESLKQDGYSVHGFIDKQGQNLDKAAAPGRRPNFWQLIGLFILVFLFWRLLSSLNLTGSAGGIQKGMGFTAAVILGVVAGTSSCLAVAGGLLLSSLATVRRHYENLPRSVAVWSVLQFVAGRVAGYAVLGGLVGWFGKALTPSPLITSALMIVASLYMVIMGLDMLSMAPAWLKRLMPRLPKSFAHKIMDAEGRDHWAMPFFLGAATFFLPCGFTQSLQLYTLSAGSVSTGILVLGGFALGTAPALLILGLASTSLKGKTGQWFFRFAGALVIVLGFLNIQNSLAAVGFNLSWPKLSWLGGKQETAQASSSRSNFPPIVNGKQVLKMAVTSYYEPSVLTVAAGVPVRWEIDASRAQGCAGSIQSRGLGIKTRGLSRGLNVIEFTPGQPGTYSFSCSMGMVRGTINVISN